MSPSNPNQELRRLKRWNSVCRWLGAIYLINFLTFLAMAQYLGGDALNGKVENGHYYLFGYIYHLHSKGHTEVTEAVFTYSKWHCYSLLVGVLLCMIASYGVTRLKAKISALEKQ